jgi:DNA-binding IclR family transcriptional regulator
LLIREFLRSPSITVSAAAEKLGVSKSTAHRLLAMLQLHGFVRQDTRSKAYLGGTTLFDIGLAMINKLDIRGAAVPSLQALVEVTGETAHLVVLQDSNVLFLDGREGPRALRAGLRIGATLPAQWTAGGRAILAGMPASRIREIWENRPSTPLTARSNSSWREFEAQLEHVRETGWASNSEETEDGLCAVAAPIAEPAGRDAVRAALVVAGPVTRMTDDRIANTAKELIRETSRVADRLNAA